MGSFDNRFRRKWQDYGGANATVAEHSFIDVFSKLFEGTEYEVISQPTFFKDLYVDVELSEKDLAEIYTPLNPQLHSRSATYIKRNGLLIRKITIKSSRPFQCAYHPLTP